jgi:hypothetical protein
MAKHKLLKHYAVWIYLKSKFSNSCYYKYNKAKMARDGGVSRSLIQKYVPMFLRWDWCSLHCGNLVFNKHSQLPDKKEKKRTLLLIRHECQEWSIDGLLDAIRVFLIKNAQRRQVHATDKKRGDRRIRAARESFQGLSFSVLKAAKLFRTSVTNGGRILRDLAKKGWYERIEQPLELMFNRYLKEPTHFVSEFLAMNKAYGVFAYRGRVYKAYPSRIYWYDGSENRAEEANPIN